MFLCPPAQTQQETETDQTQRPDAVHRKVEANPQRFHHHKDISQRLPGQRHRFDTC